MADFYTLITTLGQAAIAQAIANNTQVGLTEMALGDSNGVYYEPTEGQTALVHEVYRAAINSIAINETHPNWIDVELVIPANQGGWEIREAALYSSAGVLIAVGKVPLTYKPLLEEGAGEDLTMMLIMEVVNVEAITLLIDPSIVMASRQYVDNALEDLEAEFRKYAFFH